MRYLRLLCCFFAMFSIWADMKKAAVESSDRRPGASAPAEYPQQQCKDRAFVGFCQIKKRKMYNSLPRIGLAVFPLLG